LDGTNVNTYSYAVREVIRLMELNVHVFRHLRWLIGPKPVACKRGAPKTLLHKLDGGTKC